MPAHGYIKRKKTLPLAGSIGMMIWFVVVEPATSTQLVPITVDGFGCVVVEIKPVNRIAARSTNRNAHGQKEKNWNRAAQPINFNTIVFHVCHDNLTRHRISLKSALSLATIPLMEPTYESKATSSQLALKANSEEHQICR